MPRYDVVVVGAGILGLTSAYYIKKWNPDKSVLVIDKFASAGQGNTAKSEASFRNVFSSKTNFFLADSSVDFYFHLQNDLGYNLGLHKIGYLFLLGETSYRKEINVFREVEKKGVEVEYFEKDDLEKMIPGVVLEFSSEDEEAKRLNLENVVMGVLGKKCGYLDADSLVKFYEESFKKEGGLIQYKTLVTELILEPLEKYCIPGEPFTWQEAKIMGVKTNRGEIRADTVVVAAGAWSNILLDPVGIDARVKPKKRQIFVLKGESLEPLFNIKGFNKERVLPFVAMPTAEIYLRPCIEEKTFWVGCTDELGRKFELEEDPQPEKYFYIYGIRLVLEKYFPHFRNLKPLNAWAGQYTQNSLDANPYIFEEAGVITVTGASGSGILKGDAIGRVAAALYMGEDYAELYGGRKFKVSDLGVDERKAEKEELVL